MPLSWTVHFYYSLLCNMLLSYYSPMLSTHMFPLPPSPFHPSPPFWSYHFPVFAPIRDTSIRVEGGVENGRRWCMEDGTGLPSSITSSHSHPTALYLSSTLPVSLGHTSPPIHPLTFPRLYFPSHPPSHFPEAILPLPSTLSLSRGYTSPPIHPLTFPRLYFPSHPPSQFP